MTSRNAADSSQLEVVNPPAPPPGATEPPHHRTGNKVYKSGPLFLASRGIGWTSWKKRWFILTQTSLVFFRSDPNAIAPKGEVNLTLGGIDLNSSGSVVVKEDKKLITVLFPDGRDGRDGRTFTLKAETLEDLYEWKGALEEALANAPNAAAGAGQNGILKNDQTNAREVSLEQSKDRQPVKSLVIGRPILLALEDIDGTPSFLEKALRFIEEHGVKVEGILRQAASVDDVECRIREYEQGKTEFSPDEDAHVIADCVKYILRELPSSPVPASCCNALLEACRTERVMRLSAMRNAIYETFPEPNRRLLQRILTMMQTVAANKAHNRMSVSAVAACMAPLLLRPLLAGDCELEHNFDVGGDGSVQLLQAAAAANHAQAIVITLLEEYDKLFGEGTVTPELYSESDESGSESEELSEDEEYSEDDGEDDDVTEGSDASVDDNCGHTSTRTSSEAGGTEDNDKIADDIPESHPKLISNPTDNKEGSESKKNESNDKPKLHAKDFGELVEADPAETSTSQKSTNASNGTARSIKQTTVWGRAPAKKNLSLESIDLRFEEEAEIQRLEATKLELQNKIAEEAKGNEQLQESLERRKNDLLQRRVGLEKEVARLQEQLQKERELRAVLEAGLKVPQGPIPSSSSMDEKMKGQLEEIARAEVDVINLKQKADDLGAQINQQREQNSRLRRDQQQLSPNNHGKLKDKQKDVDSTAALNMPDRSTRNKTANSTSSALSKLTNRLNFLKERRTQIANELQNLDKSKNTGQPAQSLDRGKGSEPRRSTQNTDKIQCSEGQSSEKSRVDSYQSPHSPDGQSARSPDRERRPESHLDRGKSESFPAGEKNRSVVPPRTYSR